MKKMMLLSVASVLLSTSGVLADKSTAPGQNKVCLITFPSNDQATAGADADITNTKYLPSKAANKQETYSQGGSTRVFDYSSGNNAAERDLCQSLDPSIP
jgi:hypothetical protein